jgi:O-methyltransferase
MKIEAARVAKADRKVKLLHQEEQIGRTGGARTMKDQMREIAVRFGLESQARRLWMELKAHGWVPWGKSLIPEEAFSATLLNAIATLRSLEPAERFGDYLEFGVSRGASLACAYHCLQGAGLGEARLIGFDSFEGMPPEAAGEGWAPGMFRSSLRATETFLRQRDVDLDRVTLVKGWFSDTLTEERRAALGMDKASLIMMDCDIYSATKQALAFSAPHIGRHAIILLDDWGWRSDAGETGQREAFEEFLAENRDISAEPMPSYLPEARVFLLRRRRS